MAVFKSLARKLRLAKKGRQTRWAPFWSIPRMYGEGKKVHPGRHTSVKRHWRRKKIKKI